MRHWQVCWVSLTHCSQGRIRTHDASALLRWCLFCLMWGSTYLITVFYLYRSGHLTILQLLPFKESVGKLPTYPAYDPALESVHRWEAWEELRSRVLGAQFFVLRTGLEPVSSRVKGGCPNQLDERSLQDYFFLRLLRAEAATDFTVLLLEVFNNLLAFLATLRDVLGILLSGCIYNGSIANCWITHGRITYHSWIVCRRGCNFVRRWWTTRS